jgi:hypothetical protein
MEEKSFINQESMNIPSLKKVRSVED